VRVARGLLTLGLFVALGAAVALAIVSIASGGSGGYRVRAIFDNSSFVIPGEDVKVAGVKVGTIQAVQLTSQNKAALVLRIDDRQFQPFRTDAHCEVGLESLLGEQFIQCTPTQPRAAGAPAPAPLGAIASGPGKGQHLLPVQNTTTPVGFDLLGDITRLPQQQRLQLIISGLGAGLAANGQALNAALVRADPALQQTDRVISVLSSQNRLLAQLTAESDRVLAPLSAQRAHLGGFFRHAGQVALAAAQKGQAIEQNFRDFPAFLRQLQPAAVHLTNLAQQMTPSLQTLQAQAPAINATTQGLGPLAKSSIPALQSLGRLAQRGQTVVPRIHGVAQQLLRLGVPLLPLATQIAKLASSFDNAGGIEDVMRFIYYYTGTVNGEDAVGHYIRSLVAITSCTRTSTPPNVSGSGCGSTFWATQGRNPPSGAAAAADQPSAARAAASKLSAASTSTLVNAPASGLPGKLAALALSQGANASAKTLLQYLLAP
jgi:ABC-type transporter Mla subunit MlaD